MTGDGVGGPLGSLTQERGHSLNNLCSDEFRRYAEDADRRADNAKDQEAKRILQIVAAGYRRLVRDAERGEIFRAVLDQKRN